MTWETTDLYLAAFLFASDFDLAGTRQDGRDRTIFAFADEPDLRGVLATWQTERGTVVAHRYRDAIRDLKALVHRGAR